MFKKINSYFKDRRDRKLRERLVLHNDAEYCDLAQKYEFILTGIVPEVKRDENGLFLHF